VLRADKDSHFVGLAKLSGVGRECFAVLTNSEILVIESMSWKVHIRQKHWRDPDYSLKMHVLAVEDGIYNSVGCPDRSYYDLSLFTIEFPNYGSSDFRGLPAKLARYTCVSQSSSLDDQATTATRCNSRRCNHPISAASELRMVSSKAYIFFYYI